MSRLRRMEFYGEDVDTATKIILANLQRRGSTKMIYFDGWDGFGASAILRSIANVLPYRTTTPELCFDKIMYIDCSEWKSSREMQRLIAKELRLDCSLMAIFDKQDEEDDFLGVDQGSRDVILSVAAVIYQTLNSYRFVMIFLNGSDEEVDLTALGIPQFTNFYNNMLIWTFNRSCLTMQHDRFANKLRYTHAYLHPRNKIRTSSQFHRLLQQQAATVVARISCMQETDRTMVADCCMYELFLHCSFHTANKNKKYWVAHGSNYWLCDGIIREDKARDISIALHREINCKFDASFLEEVLEKFMEHLEPPFLVIKNNDVYEEGPYRWISVTSRSTKVHDLQTIPATTSSFFLAFEGTNHPQSLPIGLFEHSNKLRVLILCCCAFNFASPPFLKCHSLRFLGLDHCIDEKITEGGNHTEWLCLHSLWVLDLRYTVWNEILSEEKINLMINIRELNIEGVMCWQYTAQLQGRLLHLQSLRVIKPTYRWETSKDVNNSFVDKTSMEILDLSGNRDMEILPTSLSKACSIQMLVLDGCDGLENVGVPSRLPASLKSFSFDGHGPASQRTQTIELLSKQFRPPITKVNEDVRVSKISLEGCTQLKDLFLRALPNLVELDLSGTAIKILDFTTMVVQVPRLRRLFLIGCERLRAIIFFREDNNRVIKPDLELICIDMRPEVLCPRPPIDSTKLFQLQVHAVIVDARLSRSLSDLVMPYVDRNDQPKVVSYNIHVQLEATSKDNFDLSDQGSLQQFIPAGQYSDVLRIVNDPPMQTFPQAPATQLDRHIEIAEGSCYLESELEGDLGFLMEYSAESLHLHNVSIRDIFTRKEYCVFYHLRWCCVERCPKLDTVFPSRTRRFSKLEIFWASDLLMARWIWSKGSRHISGYSSNTETLRNLRHLHLRSCPSLQFVIPVWVSSFPSLETLHIIHCGDLVHVFELDELYPEEISLGVLFPKLTIIHLHDLPKLRQISKVKMVAPALETIRIRGCWGLRSLPSVGGRGRGAKKPTIEIEKDVWDALEWDAGHRPDHFESPVHSLYYKKKLPRVSVLM